MDHQFLIRWLRECYREDHSRSGVRDFLAKSLENRQVLRGSDQLACGFLEEDVLAPAYAEKLMLNLTLYQREKECLYGCLFCVGKMGGKVYRAPLILYPVTTRKESEAMMVSLQLGLYRINYAFLDMLDNKREIEQGVEAVMQESEGVLTSVAVSEIANIFKASMPEVDVECLMEWPNLVHTADERARVKLKSRLKILPSAGFAVVKRASGSSGVVDELDHLGGLEKSGWSRAMAALLDDESSEGAKESKYRPTLAPALLSETQEYLLRSARRNDLTVCHGPPGTGKSFTLAAIAIDHIARGESVLVVSRKDHAVDVLHSNICELLDDSVAVVRAGRSSYLKGLKNRIGRVLAQKYVSSRSAKDKLDRIVENLMAVLNKIEIEGQELSEEYERSIFRGEVSAKPNPSWFESLLKIWYERQTKGRPILMELSAYLSKLHEIKEVHVRDLIRAQQEFLVNGVKVFSEKRGDLKKLLNGLRRRKSADQVAAFSSANFETILDVFPIWVISLSDLHRVLPPSKEMFDVVIIDEASQCDMASALPAIQRAKRVVIAGDAKQLRHVAFIANASMQKFASELDLTEEDVEKYNYRNVSLMDMAIENTHRADQVALLNEHFRSLKPIIEFSNAEFYANELRLMRDRPWEKDSADALVFRYCEGDRGENGVNEGEEQAVIEDLARLVEGELGDVRGRMKTSIGILSPFRAQVDALTKAVNAYAEEKRYAYLLTQHDLKIGTAHSFQGEERDVMLISMALGRSDHRGTLRFLEQEDVFNVSITRAKQKQRVYHSVQAGDLPASSLLARFLGARGRSGFSETRKSGACVGLEADRFVQEISQACVERGIHCRVGESVAAIPVDVLLEKDGVYLGIDLVGYPGFAQEAVEIKRQQILERAGMKLVPVGYVEWQVQRENVLLGIDKLLG